MQTKSLTKRDQREGLITEQAAQMTKEQVELLKTTICRGATDDELKLFIHACDRSHLDPFMKQIHAVKRWDGRLKREVMSIQVGIDGFRLVADRSGKYAGNDEPTFDEEESLPYPRSASVSVWKIVQGMRCEFTATARWSEYAAKKRDGNYNTFWASKPYIMLGKCAEALALRKAFPAELSGLYTNDEMDQAGPTEPMSTPADSAPKSAEPAPSKPDPFANSANTQKVAKKATKKKTSTKKPPPGEKDGDKIMDADYRDVGPPNAEEKAAGVEPQFGPTPPEAEKPPEKGNHQANILILRTWKRNPEAKRVGIECRNLANNTVFWLNLWADSKKRMERVEVVAGSGTEVYVTWNDEPYKYADKETGEEKSGISRALVSIDLAQDTGDVS